SKRRFFSVETCSKTHVCSRACCASFLDGRPLKVALGLRFDGRVSRHRLSKRRFFSGGNLLQNARMQSGVLREFFGRAAIESVDQEKPSKSGARLVSSIKPARFAASIILAVVTWARAQPSLFVLCAHRKDEVPSVASHQKQR